MPSLALPYMLSSWLPQAQTHGTKGLEERDGKTKSLEGDAVKFPDQDSTLTDRRKMVRIYVFQLWSEQKKTKKDHFFQCAGGAAYERAIQSIKNIPSALLWADESQALM